ncbi:zinc ribbon domain-containing protein [Duganella vulcania]|uniref:zinc ribbon domain-containing protein n=1 Tax=Duganella vulcania TaxID=2692166 RepID=UPI00403CBD30
MSSDLFRETSSFRARSERVCSHCGALPDTRPNGIADLGVREWCCSDCGVVHDRDRNAAVNILRRGRATLAVGISAL